MIHISVVDFMFVCGVLFFVGMFARQLFSD